MADSAPGPLTVAVTGPTGDIGRSLLRALDRSREVKTVNAMARKPFDPQAAGLRKTSYRQGDVLDRDSVDRLVTDADARVLRPDGEAIPGLYACGNASSSVMGNSYAGPGATIGPAMVFGWVAAHHIAAQKDSAQLREDGQAASAASAA